MTVSRRGSPGARVTASCAALAVSPQSILCYSSSPKSARRRAFSCHGFQTTACQARVRTKPWAGFEGSLGWGANQAQQMGIPPRMALPGV
ncbi:MAG: hypothetical protein RLZZ387_178 [Chloroflexota bacterium]|jgi:hypothetical protein